MYQYRYKTQSYVHISILINMYIYRKVGINITRLDHRHIHEHARPHRMLVYTFSKP